MRFRFGGAMMVFFGAALVAHGDDITLSSTATRDEIQAALDARDDGSTVTLPAGTYDIDETISITTDVKLKGAGMYATILKATETFDKLLTLDNAAAVVSGVCVSNVVSNGTGTDGLAVKIAAGRLEYSRVTCSKGAGKWNRFGAISMHGASAVLSHCRVDHNLVTDTGGRGAVAAWGGSLVENCFIDHNKVLNWGGGVYCYGACSIVNCTVVDNTATSTKGGGIWCDNKNVKIINCLVRRNVGSGADSDIYMNAAGTVKHTACREGVGTDPISANPEFKDPDNGDYTLLVSSPCLDAGSESDATAAIGSAVATDFAGATRVMGSEIEIGCYEYDPSQTACAFAADANEQFLGTPVRLTASTSGFGDAADIVYSWSLLLAGESTPVAKTGSPLDFTAAKPGYYSVSLTATSASAGKSCSSSKSDYFYVAPLTNYVTSAKVGTAVFPYGTPETAATNITDAVGAAIDGSVIYLPAGVHDVSACVSVTKNLRIVGDGSDATILKATGTFSKMFFLNHNSSVVSGVCITNVLSNGSGNNGTAVEIQAGRLEYSRVTGCRGNGNWNRYGTVSLHSANAVVSHCRLDNNTMTASGNWGAGLMATGGGLVENCLIDHNTAQCYGGVYCYGACSIVNCTIVDNTATSGSGGGLCCNSSSAKVINCLVRRNTGGGADADLLLNSGTVKHTASREGVGTDPVSADPEFKDPANGDYTLLVSSPCVDAGSTNEAKTAIGADAVTDYAGLKRVMGKEIDIGCHEYDTSQAACAFAADKSELLMGTSVRLTASTSGFEGVSDLVYSWSLLLKGESTPIAKTGSPLDFTPTKAGYYSVSLTATSASAGKSCSSSKSDYFYVAPLTNFVTAAKVDTAVFPYGTPETAATNIQDAVDAAIDGSVIWLPADTYDVGSCVTVTKGVKIIGEGKDATILKASGIFDRMFYLNNKSALVSGVCVSNIVTTTWGGDGFAVLISAGRFEYSYVTCCTVQEGWNRHGCICAGGADASISHCRIHHNTFVQSGNWGAVMATGGALVENCLVDHNDTQYYAGIYCPGACNIVNCTVVDNTATSGSGAGIYCDSTAANLINTLVRRNVGGGADTDICLNQSGTVSHTASREGVGTDPVSADPEFTDAANGDYTLLVSSPCVDAGSTNEAKTAIGADAATDYAGLKRVMGKEIDIGCYEYDTSQATCAFAADKSEMLMGTSVRLTASTSGFEDVTDVVYSWKLTQTGLVVPIERTGSPIDFTAKKPGRYSVSLTVSSESAGKSCSLSKADYFYVAPLTNYVTHVQSNVSVFPYDSPAAAATNLQDAIDAAIDGSVVWLPAATYTVKGQVSATKGVRIAGAGRDATILKAASSGSLSFYLNNASSVLSGVCISNVVSNGSGAQSGFVAVISAGRMEDSRVTCCKTRSGDWNRKGTVSVQSANAVLSRCRIDHNTMIESGNWGGGVMATGGGLVENCLIDNNKALSVGGLYCGGSCSIVNCTVVSNRVTTADEGVGVYAQNGQIHNTIIVDNFDKDGVESNIYGKDYFSYSLSPSFPKAKNGNIVNRPRFRPWRLYIQSSQSPGWRTGSVVGYESLLLGGTDLNGRPRVSRMLQSGTSFLDIGSTESDVQPGLVIVVE